MDGGVSPPSTPPHAVLELTVHYSQPRYNLNSALQELHPPLLLLPKCCPYPRFPSLVGFFRHNACHMIWLTCHDSRIIRVCLSADPVEDSGEGIIHPLYTIRLGQYCEAIVAIEIFRQVNDCQSKSPMPNYVGFTTFTQWQMTASTSLLKIVGERGLPCVMSCYPLNRHPKYPSVLATMFSQSQFVQRSRSVLGLTP